ncbi:carbohydrate-binding protein [Acinetobacter lwoffii]|uniref:carbohydrate-binding protein n=1 Tax=Acinetobacter lwoffii TaxID=28090 RepID=UPI001FF3E44A|nr:carbohydrate-binding protein [Acinetobacter lwoffii]MCJ8512249.1 carbohydrate-binding protein [Acinetobacter lwoffii]
MKQWLLKNNLSSGELSPLLHTRTDVQQYANGAKKLLNAIPLVEGGAKKRPGTKFRGIFAGALRLIPFVPNSDNPFLLILGINTLQVYDPLTQSVVHTGSTPYNTVAKVSQIQVAHSRYRMFFVQGDHPVHRLVCSKDFDNWNFDQFTFVTAPVDEINTTPNVALTPTGVEVGKTISLNAAAFPNWSSTENYIIGERVIYLGQTWRAIADSTGKVPAVDSTDWESVTAGDASVFIPAHVGAIISINGGQVKITSYVSPTGVLGEVIVKLNADVQAIAKSWILNTAAFTAETGYPSTVTFFKQRLVFANTKNNPNQLWVSAIGNDGDFLEATDDASAFSMASSSAQADNILHLAQRGGVVALTGGSEFLISSAGAFTPASAQIEQHTTYGAQSNVRPCLVGNELLFVQRGGNRLRALSYRYEVDGLVSPELSAIAPHIAEDHGGIKELTYQQTPYSLVWMVLNDGKVASITLNRDQEMNAWAQHDFGGAVRSICALPQAAGNDLCFMLVARKSAVVLEQLDETSFMDCEIAHNGALVNRNLHNSTQYRFQNADGYFYDDNQPTSSTWFAGQPFNMEVEFLPPDHSQVPNTAMFHKIQAHETVLYVRNSIGGQCNQYDLEHKSFNQSAFQNLTYTGPVSVSMNGWATLHEMELKITHNKPLPFHVQSVAMLVSMNER